MAIKLVLFDLDGTLVDTVRDISNALNYALNAQGMKGLTVEESKGLIGEGVTRLIEKVLADEESPLKDAVLRKFLEHYSEHLADYSVPYPNVRETLGKLGGCKKAIISNKNESLSRKLLERLDLIDHFGLVIGSDTASERKPSAVPVIYGLSKFNVGPREAAIVGDSNYDIEAGKRAGVSTIAVTYGYGEIYHLRAADYTISDFSGLPPLLDIISAELI